MPRALSGGRISSNEKRHGIVAETPLFVLKRISCTRHRRAIGEAAENRVNEQISDWQLFSLYWAAVMSASNISTMKIVIARKCHRKLIGMCINEAASSAFSTF